jgi:hypothetical protein
MTGAGLPFVVVRSPAAVHSIRAARRRALVRAFVLGVEVAAVAVLLPAPLRRALVVAVLGGHPHAAITGLLVASLRRRTLIGAAVVGVEVTAVAILLVAPLLLRAALGRRGVGALGLVPLTDIVGAAGVGVASATSTISAQPVVR